MQGVKEWLVSRDDEETGVVDHVSQANRKPGEVRFEDDVLVEDDDILFPEDAPTPVKAGVPGREGWVLTPLVKFIYGLADFGCVAFAAIMGFYLNAFLLEVAGVGAAAAGTLLLVCKVVDAVADPFIGWASDRTRSRFGRRKIWIACAALPLSVVYVAIWLVPPLTGAAQFGYYMAMLVLLSVFISCVSLPVSALGPELTQNYDERTSLMVFKVAVFCVANIAATFAHSMLIEAFPAPPIAAVAANITSPACVAFLNASAVYINGTLVERPGVDYQRGYLVSAVLWATFALVPIVLLLVFVPERKPGRNKPSVRRDGSVRYRKLTVFESFRTMFGNRAFICVMLVYLFSQLAIQFVQNNLFLWCKWCVTDRFALFASAMLMRPILQYVLRREEWFSYLLLVLLGTTFLTLPLWERVARHVGKPRVFAMGALITMVMLMYAFCFDYLPPHVADVTVWFVAVLAGVGQASLNLAPVAMFPDVIERDELATGLRREGIYYSFFVFFQKLALAGALAVSNFVLSGAGYLSPEVAGCSTPLQSDTVRLAMGIMIGPVPAAVLSLSLVALWFYPITKEAHLHTLKELDEERKRRALVTTDSEATHRTRDVEASAVRSRDAERKPKSRVDDFQ